MSPSKKKPENQAIGIVLPFAQEPRFTLPDAYQAWLLPVSEDKPCGDFLEYDTDYCMLQARFTPKEEQHYGDFRQAPPALDWVQLERDCEALLRRSRDITLLVWLLTCRTKRAGIKGLHQGVTLLYAMATKWDAHIHPQTTIDGVEDFALRSNALLGLTDPEAFLLHFRDLVVVKNSTHQLTVRDVERACSVPRAPEALDTDFVRSVLRDLHTTEQTEVLALEQVHLMLKAIDTWASETLGDDSPNLNPLLKVTQFFDSAYLFPQEGTAALGSDREDDSEDDRTDDTEDDSDDRTDDSENETAHDSDSDSESNSDTDSDRDSRGSAPARAPRSAAHKPSPSPSSTRSSSQTDLHDLPPRLARAAIQSELQNIEKWFLDNEPSSPIAILLRQTRLLIGKSYPEIVRMLPQELISTWSDLSENPSSGEDE